MIYPKLSLDDKDRCCGKKPLVYKRYPHFYCTRCDRAFDLETKIITEEVRSGMMDPVRTTAIFEI